jgi:hypothetical protein
MYRLVRRHRGIQGSRHVWTLSEVPGIIAAEPNPERQRVQISLPRISFEIKGLAYDGSRKLAPTQFAKTQPTKGPEVKQPVQYQQFLPVPYNLEIEMAIIAKNQDDGLQIIEQILPAFQPSLNVSIEVIDVTHEERDIAIVLNGIGYTDDYEGDYTTRRHSYLDTELHRQDLPLRSCSLLRRISARSPSITVQTSIPSAIQRSVTLRNLSLHWNHLSQERDRSYGRRTPTKSSRHTATCLVMIKTILDSTNETIRIPGPNL